MKDVDIKNLTENYEDNLLFQRNWLDHGDYKEHKIYQYKDDVIQYLEKFDNFNGED